ncbi:hypothetical protein ACVIGB_008198 [Bradyrhizobium sp. USDA 4341]|jgi:hypothetical protein
MKAPLFIPLARPEDDVATFRVTSYWPTVKPRPTWAINKAAGRL